MNNKDSVMLLHRIVGIITLLVMIYPVHAIIPLNLFEAYNVLLLGYRPPRCFMQLAVNGEFGFHTTGFTGSDHESLYQANSAHRVNVMQIYDAQQNALAALSGTPASSWEGQFAQLFSRDGDNGTYGRYVPSGSLKVYCNIPFELRFRLPYALTLGCYLAYRDIALTDVTWQEQNPLFTLDQNNGQNILEVIAKGSGLSLYGWHRRGFGDLLVRVEMYRTYLQQREWLKMVGITLRSGVLFPTGLRGDSDKPLAFGFGNDGGFGIHVSGMLQLCYAGGMTVGIDGELLHLFGNTRDRRIKTDPAQTSFLLPTKIPVFCEPGFSQNFTLFIEKGQRAGGLIGTLAYQYIKRNDDLYFPCVEGYDQLVMNNARPLFETTGHSLVLMLSYDWSYKADWQTVPACSVLVKAGFNGKRSLVADTVCLHASVAF